MRNAFKLLAGAVLLAAIVTGVVSLVPKVAHAQGVINLLIQLNGNPVRVGTLTSTGTSASVTLTSSAPHMVMCDAAAHIGNQATCHATITNANYCPYQAANERMYFIPTGLTLTAISVSGTANCSYFVMR